MYAVELDMKSCVLVLLSTCAQHTRCAVPAAEVELICKLHSGAGGVPVRLEAWGETALSHLFNKYPDKTAPDTQI